MKTLIILIILSFNSFSFWDTELSDNIDRFIYEETTYYCQNHAKIESIEVTDILSFPLGEIYTVQYQNHQNYSGEMIVSFTFQGDLNLDDFQCPSF